MTQRQMRSGLCLLRAPKCREKDKQEKIISMMRRTETLWYRQLSGAMSTNRKNIQENALEEVTPGSSPVSRIAQKRRERGGRDMGLKRCAEDRL